MNENRSMIDYLPPDPADFSRGYSPFLWTLLAAAVVAVGVWWWLWR